MRLKSLVCLACALLLAGCAGYPPKRQPFGPDYWRALATELEKSRDEARR